MHLVNHLSPAQKVLYTRLRILLWIVIIVGGGSFIMSMLFPTITQSFDFDNPGSSRNTIVDPRAVDNTSLTTGKVNVNDSLIANTSLLGDFSSATIRFTLEADSARPEAVTANLKRDYRALLLPPGEPMTSAPQDSIVLIGSTHYLVKDNTLFPFVSEAAYQSRYPETYPVSRLTQVPAEWNISEQFLGFRVGSLLSFADGVFVVTSETEMRPIGSAEIFLALGYRFEDVKPVSEEELGIYKRGRIILLNTPPIDGTLYRDLDTNEVFMIENGKQRVVTDPTYRTFLEGKQLPIPTRSHDREETVGCKAVSELLPRTYRCQVPLDIFHDNLGFDYELMVHGTNTDFEIETLSIAFNTHITTDNARTLVAKVKQRILARFGLAPQ
ncbi:MAG: hypothetical protein E6R05_04210 [Candidatus Moraniibacteriota bacterium]|nr:MAG: hypothetical protein E6R05_04210 [Candidatus Moranbacteria bacterium]